MNSGVRGKSTRVLKAGRKWIRTGRVKMAFQATIKTTKGFVLWSERSRKVRRDQSRVQSGQRVLKSMELQSHEFNFLFFFLLFKGIVFSNIYNFSKTLCFPH